MDQPDNGGDLRAERATNGYGTSSSLMPAGFGALYQAAYEAGYQKGYGEGYRDARSHASAKPEAASVAPASLRRGLLGMPCERCGTFLFSDETQCPHCKTEVTSA